MTQQSDSSYTDDTEDYPSDDDDFPDDTGQLLTAIRQHNDLLQVAIASLTEEAIHNKPTKNPPPPKRKSDPTYIKPTPPPSRRKRKRHNKRNHLQPSRNRSRHPLGFYDKETRQQEFEHETAPATSLFDDQTETTNEHASRGRTKRSRKSRIKQQNSDIKIEFVDLCEE